MSDKFDPDAYLAEEFNPDDYLAESIDPKDEGRSKTKSFFDAATQSAAFGFGDELAGLTEAAGRVVGLEGVGGDIADIGVAKDGPTLNLQQLMDAYKAGRDDTRKSLEKSREDNPVTSFAGDIAGALASGGAIAKGAQALAGAGKISQGAAKGLDVALGTGAKGMKQMGAAGTAGGALYGAGYSEADDVGELASDVAWGAGLGGATGLAIPGLINAAKGAKKAISNVPMIGDVVDATKYGYKGVNVAGKEAFDETGKAFESTMRELGEGLDDTGTRLAKEQGEILKKSGKQFSAKEFADDLGVAEAEIRSARAPMSKKAQDARTMRDVATGVVEKQDDVIPAQQYYREIRDEIKNIVDDSYRGEGGMRTAVGKQQVKQIYNNMRERIYREIPELAQHNKVVTEYLDAMESIGFEKVNDAFLSSKDKTRITEKLFNIMKNLETETFGKFKAMRVLGTIEEALSKTNPELAQTVVPRVKDLAIRFDLAKKSVGSGNMIGQALTLGGQTITAGQTLGKTAKAIKDTLVNSKPAELARQAEFYARMNVPGAKKLGNILQSMIEKDHGSRKAILFGVMQNPAYRRLLGLEKEE